MKPMYFLLLCLMLLLPACSQSRGSRGPNFDAIPAPPAMISHIVFIELANPSDFHELLKDADWMLGTIPAVSTFAAGKHLDTGRRSVSADYDLAIYLGFDSEQDLATYVAHPQHIAFVDKWILKVESLRVFDMIDWPTTRATYFR